MKQSEYKDNVTDYINGHLSNEHLIEFEAELARNSQLANDLQEAKVWQSQLQSAQLDVPEPQFSSIEKKLKQGKRNWSYGLSTAAAVTLAVFLFVNTDYVPNNEFETLTDAHSSYNAPVMQIVLSENVDVASLATDYNLNIIETYPNSQIIDVELDPKLEGNLKLLNADKRTVLLKKIGLNE